MEWCVQKYVCEALWCKGCEHPKAPPVVLFMLVMVLVVTKMVVMMATSIEGQSHS